MIIKNPLNRFSLFRSISVFKKRHFSANSNFDVVVIGAGPGGYVAAIKASQLGLKTACVEKNPTLGGTCLNVGCIPSKALLNASHLYKMAKNDFSKYGITTEGCRIDIEKMQKAKSNSVKSLTSGIQHLFRKNNVTWLKGKGSLESSDKVRVESPDGALKTVTASNIILATGSSVAPLRGVEIDEKDILSSTGALELKEVPKRLVVIGAGVIGLEMGSVWSRLGSKVSVIEYFDRLVPGIDAEVAKEFTRILKKQGLQFKFGSAVQSVEKSDGELEVSIKGRENGKESIISCDKVLVAVGRRSYYEGLNLENAGVEVEKGKIKTDESLRTTAQNIFAIGDATKGDQLAHKAEEEGIAVAELIANKNAHLNYEAIPKVIYTSPEVAHVGKTEEELLKGKIPFKKGVFPFLANSRAKTVDDYEGFVKVLSDAKTDRVLGVHIIGEQAGDLIQEACLAMNYGGSSEDIARTCHAHPTRSEALKEAALAASSKAIHF